MSLGKKNTWEKTSQGKNVCRIKCKMEKMSQGKNVFGKKYHQDKLSWEKMSWEKMSLGKNINQGLLQVQLFFFSKDVPKIDYN